MARQAAPAPPDDDDPDVGAPVAYALLAIALYGLVLGAWVVALTVLAR